MSDWNNDYSAAGPGYKRRTQAKREYLGEPKVKPKPKLRLNNAERHRPRQDADDRTWTGRIVDTKGKIIKLSLQLAKFHDVNDRLEREGYGPVSRVLISNSRDWTMSVLRVCIAEGLITEKALARYRADAHDEQKRRFKRRDD
jgi:hypothetical protein